MGKEAHLNAVAAYEGAKSAAAQAAQKYAAAVKAHCDAEAQHAKAVKTIGHGHMAKNTCSKWSGRKSGSPALSVFTKSSNGYWMKGSNHLNNICNKRYDHVGKEACAKKCLDFGDNCLGFEVYQPTTTCYHWTKSSEAELKAMGCTWHANTACHGYTRKPASAGPVEVHSGRCAGAHKWFGGATKADCVKKTLAWSQCMIQDGGFAYMNWQESMGGKCSCCTYKISNPASISYHDVEYYKMFKVSGSSTGKCGAEIAGFERIGTAKNNQRCQEGYSDNGCGGRKDCRIPGGGGNFPSAAKVAEKCAANSQCKGFNWIDQGAYLHNADTFYKCTPTTFSGNHIKWSVFVKC